ncbi:Hsp20/alpha crystallin family protein [Natronomonas salina]|uniref:Hsp20/alpha crystallin family protein n=1 Tax=Natronomonas salina TaxID=1710540 RepID=UPI0015B546FA|nr:Hsp20/alpha crystallin family protein [Natronomonas salina]QLD89858.1 Hsp20/alpha crystallin family protein [Natronomonas salina]
MSRNPFDEIERMFDRMSSQFDPTEGGALGGPLGGSVAVDVEDAGDEYVVTADLPGYDREDIDVQLAGERLTVSADHTDATTAEEDDGRYVRKERRQQSVSRTIRLPEAVDESGTEAEYNNGVLTVTLPKVGVDDGHDIPIN